jgi:GT2 family glycosyltransferase
MQLHLVQSGVLASSGVLAALAGRARSMAQPLCGADWLAIVRAMVSHTKGLRRETWRLARDYWTIHCSELFDRDFYLARYPDVADEGFDPLLHYLCYGEQEGRRPSRLLSLPKLRDLIGTNVPPGSNLLATLLRDGAAAGGTAASLAAATTPSLPQLRYVGPPIGNAKRIVVYTAIFDGYDGLQQPDAVSDDADYVCFSDAPIQAPGAWHVRALDYFHCNPRRMARFAKLHPHLYFPDHEWSLWIDGRVKLRVDPIELVRQSSGRLTAFWHPNRTNPFDEADEVIALGLDGDDVVRRQMSRYRALGLPADAPLHETNVLLRRHNDEVVVAHSRRWFAEMQSGSVRDQLSFDFAAWQTGLTVESFGPRPLNVRSDPRFSVSRHLNRKRNATSRINDPDAGPGVPPVLRIESPAARSTEATPVDVIVCVHNALDDVARCLESVERTRTEPQRLIVVDDGSDSETRHWLSAHVVSWRDDAVLVRRESAGGYTIAANEGLRRSTAPVVALLNSDTIVPAGWLAKLLAALESGPDIGLSGPLSNAAGFQSVPDIQRMVDGLPDGKTVEDMDRLCQKLAGNTYPRVPILNGFCLMVRRSVIDRIGLFDEETFGRGYGEENDYCFRAWDAGYSAVVACDTYVFHAKSRSYTRSRRKQLIAPARAALAAKWSEERVSLASQTLEGHPWLAAMRLQVAQALARDRES